MERWRALAIQHSGIEQKTNKAIEEKLAWNNDPELERAGTLMENGQLADALPLLTNYVAAKPNSLDAWNLLRQIHTRQNNTKEYLDATVKTCALHLRAHQVEAAFQDYAEFIDSGGSKMPAATWLELCKGAEEIQEFDRALAEYQTLAQSYPGDRQALTAQLSAARLCLKRLNRPQDALALYQAAAASPIPHLDWDQHIQSGIKEAKAAMSCRECSRSRGTVEPASRKEGGYLKGFLCAQCPAEKACVVRDDAIDPVLRETLHVTGIIDGPDDTFLPAPFILRISSGSASSY